MDDASLARFANILHKKRPTLIFGHAHSVYLIAQFLRTESTGAFTHPARPAFRPKGIITTAMVLHSWQRQTIEEVFDCPVTNRYGCEEVSLIACECERHNGLHVNSDGVYVEILRADDTGALTRPARSGESGSIVVTDLSNRAMPIIRYQVGDVAAFSNRFCPCGRGLPLLERIEGREADYVVTSAGNLISGISLTENFALQVPGVVQFQIVQEALQRFLFRLVRGPEFGPNSLKRLEELVARHFGPEVEYRCEYLERIPSEPSGKYRFCISRVPHPLTQTREVAAA
jgi:phenylacetate-CoA ligase